jgi:hypothetical protein
MIDPSKGWLEIKELNKKEAINPVNFVEQTWLTRYPIPQILAYDRGTEFMPKWLKMITVSKKRYYSPKPTSKCDPRMSASNH